MTTTLPVPSEQAPQAGSERRPAGWDLGDLAILAGWVVFVIAVNRWGRDLALTTEIGLGEPPLHANWAVRLNAGTLLAIGLGGMLIWYGPRAARTLPWRWLVVAVVAVAAAWGMALAMNDGVDGWTRGVAPETDYVRVADEVDDPGSFLDAFTADIRNGTHPTHVAGHPPGFVLLLWLLRAVGLTGTGWATALVIVGGSAALGVILVTVRVVTDEAVARGAAVFLAVSPAAVRLVTTPDAFFALPAALAAGALCVAAYRDGRRADLLAIGGGLAMGATILLSYGLALIAVIPIAVCWRRRTVRPLVIGAAVTAAVIVALVPAGYWWLDGLEATRERYWSGYAATRPQRYFLFANVAALGLTIGPAAILALRRIRTSPVAVLVVGAVGAMLLANLSAMSKGEVERIWLPFALWVLPIGAVYASRTRWLQSALALQVAAAVLLQTVVHSS
jgi:hypothetical protein